MIWHLYYYEDYSVKEIADILKKQEVMIWHLGTPTEEQMLQQISS